MGFQLDHTARLRRLLVLVALAGSPLLLPGDLSAQGAEAAESDPFAGVEEMIVVGSELLDTLNATSTSVTAFDSMQLEALGVSNVSDVAAFTPNLEIRAASATTATFFIRGVGLNDFTANAASAVAIYVDEAPRNLPAIQLGLLYDLQAIEVSKGPQGSGPGRNASAGAIRINTKKPTGEHDAYVKFLYGNYNLLDLEGALEIPIVEDVLAMRSAFRIQQRDGIVKNRCGGLSLDQINAGGPHCGESPGAVIRPGLEEDLNNTDVWSTRSSLRFIPPIDGMEWNLVTHVDRTDQLGTVGQQIGAQSALGSTDNAGYRAPEVAGELNRIVGNLNIPSPAECRRDPDPVACRARAASLRVKAESQLSNSLASRPLDALPFDGDYNNPGYERQTSVGFTLAGEWELDAVTLQSITGYERYDRERLIDADFSPNVVFEFDIEDNAWQVSQDLRLSGDLESIPLAWNTGAFYLQEELDYDQDTLAQSGAVQPLFQAYIQETASAGLFVDVSWELLDDLTLDAGARYNWERKTFDAEIFAGANMATDSCRVTNSGNVPECNRTDTVDHPTGGVGLTYHFDELRSFYLKYSHGWKGLQYNARDGLRASDVTDVADPEQIDAYEIGFKGSWLEDRLSLDGSLFWYAYSNYQVFTFSNDTGVPPTRIVQNADDAQNFGAELATVLRPIDGLLADVRFGWLETKFLDFTSSVSRPVPNGNGAQFRLVNDFNGNQLPNAPRFKVSASLEYMFDLDRMGRITPRYDVVWSDDVNFDPSGGTGAPNVQGLIFLPDHTIGQKAFTQHNLQLNWVAPSEHLEVGVWARNLTNEVYKSLAFDATGGPGFVGNLLGDPRTYGLSVKLLY